MGGGRGGYACRMANPALLLHDLLSRWLVPEKSSVEQVRKAYVQNEADGIGFWKMQAIAMGYLTEVEAALDAIAPADLAYRQLVPVWAEALLHPYTHWQHQVGGTRQIESLELGALLMLANHLDAIGYAPSFDADEVESLRGALDEFEQRVLGSDRLLPDIRMYLMKLLRECRAVLDDIQIYGETKFRSVSLELAGAVTATAEAAADGGDKDTWSKLSDAVRSFVRDLLRTYAVSQGLGVLESAGTQLALDTGAKIGGEAGDA